MSYNFEKIFTYYTKDPKWIQKIIVVALYYILATVFFLIPLILLFVTLKTHNIISFAVSLPICWVLAGLLFCVPNGFCMQAGNMRLQNEQYILPELKDFFKQAFIGLKYVIGCAILYCPILILAIIVYIYYPDYYNKEADYTAKCFFIDVISDALSLFLSCLMPVFVSLYMEKLNPFVFFNYKKAVLKIKENFVPFLILAGITFAANILFWLSFLSILLVVGIFIVPILDVILTLICTETAVQFAKLEKKVIEENNEE